MEPYIVRKRLCRCTPAARPALSISINGHAQNYLDLDQVCRLIFTVFSIVTRFLFLHIRSGHCGATASMSWEDLEFSNPLALKVRLLISIFVNKQLILGSNGPYQLIPPLGELQILTDNFRLRRDASEGNTGTLRIVLIVAVFLHGNWEQRVRNPSRKH